MHFSLFTIILKNKKSLADYESCSRLWCLNASLCIHAQNSLGMCADQDVIELRQGSWFEPLDGMNNKLAGIISNPPYIPSEHISGLQAEVGRHEPRIALDGGVDGMDDLLHLCKGAASMLKPGGFFAFEVRDSLCFPEAPTTSYNLQSLNSIYCQ